MDLQPPSRSSRLHRPQIFVSVEFGVSWSPSHQPRPHALHYRSRGLRERSPNFPRQVPPRNTNYLAYSTTTAQAQAQPQSQQEVLLQAPQHPQQYHQQHQHQPHPHHHQQQQQQRNLQPPRPREHSHSQQSYHQHQQHLYDDAAPSRRSSRSSRSSHERGRSAPPPISDNNWDVIQQPQSSRALPGSSAEATASRPPPSLWKDLPEIPSRFRLGEDGMPWSAWSWPMGYDPDADPEHEDPRFAPRRSSKETAGHERDEDDIPLNSPTLVDIQSPLEEPRYRREDPTRVRDLEALGQAMMTIDNGFEDQWWSQGDRQPITPVAAGDLISSAATGGGPPPQPTPSADDFASAPLPLGWTNAVPPLQLATPPQLYLNTTGAAPAMHTPPQGAPDERLAFATATHNVVSPVSDFASSPPMYSRLTRTMSTRSEELWFPGDRYA